MAIYKSKFTGKQVDELLGKIDGKQDKLTAGNGITINNNIISASSNFTLYEVVSELPALSKASKNKIYLKLSSTTSTQAEPGESTEIVNKYTEYILVNNTWEILGELQTTIDLSIYATKSDLDTLGDSIDPLGESVNTLSDTVDSNSAKITALESNMNSLVSDADYEVILFKKSS